MERIKELTIIIPAFNEELGIKKTVIDILNASKNKPYKILVVNDGSTDRTLLNINDVDGIEVITHPYNKGYGASLKTGILNSQTDYVAFYDSDGQHNPRDLIRLWENRHNYDMIVGERGKDSHVDLIRMPGKWILNKTANFLVGKKIPDLNSGLRVIKREQILKVLHLMPDGFSFTTTSTVAFFNLKYNVGYVPIRVNQRIGTSTVRQLKHGPETLLLILRLMVLFNPLKVFLSLSAVTFLFGIMYELYYGIFLVYPDVKLMPAALLLLLTSLLFFFFGLVVDQISELRKQQIK